MTAFLYQRSAMAMVLRDARAVTKPKPINLLMSVACALQPGAPIWTRRCERKRRPVESTAIGNRINRIAKRSATTMYPKHRRANLRRCR